MGLISIIGNNNKLSTCIFFAWVPFCNSSPRRTYYVRINIYIYIYIRVLPKYNTAYVTDKFIFVAAFSNNSNIYPRFVFVFGWSFPLGGNTLKSSTLFVPKSAFLSTMISKDFSPYTWSISISKQRKNLKISTSRACFRNKKLQLHCTCGKHSTVSRFFFWHNKKISSFPIFHLIRTNTFKAWTPEALV